MNTTQKAKVTTTLLNSSPIGLTAEGPLSRTSIQHTQSFRKIFSRASAARPIRGKELFIRSARRIVEQIRSNREKSNNLNTLASYEDAIKIFDDLTFFKCIQLKKRLTDPSTKSWTIEFSRQGGLCALLNYIEKLAARGLSLVDAILVNEILQCLRAMMNIVELFEHILNNSKYVDSIVKSRFQSIF